MTMARFIVGAILFAICANGANAQSGTSMQHRHGAAASSPPAEAPAVPPDAGQAAFGAIQRIVALLQADPATDWTKVDIDALREHLIDMDEVTMRAAVAKQPIENGLRVAVTGTGRTLEAIRRMVPDHARQINGLNGWSVVASPIPDGVVLVVTAADTAGAQRIRALGFMGLMAQGAHHQMHHVAMARGIPIHAH